MHNTFFGFSSIEDFLISLTGIYSQKALVVNTISTGLVTSATFITQ